MAKIIFNNFKLLLSKKSFIIMGVIAPAIVIMLFSFSFGKSSNYKVGVINNDNNYISKEIINTIHKIENVDIVEIKDDEVELLLITHQIQMAVIIEKDFSKNILNEEKDQVIIKSINNSDVVSIISDVINSKSEDLSLISSISNGSIEKFKELDKEYNENSLNINTNELINDKASIDNSIGIVIMIIFIVGSSISNFLIEDEENKTKSRILASGVSITKYYTSMVVVFYILSCVTTIIYYSLCKIFKLDFLMDNTTNFLIVLLFINLVSVSLNLCIVSLTKSRYVASTINILIVVPTCMMSGVFWDFSIMPEYMKKIGELLPQRWVYICLEKLQTYNNIKSISNYLIYMLLLSVGLFILSIIIHKLKKSKY